MNQFKFTHPFQKGGLFKQVGEKRRLDSSKSFIPLMYGEQTGGYNPNVDPNQPQNTKQQLDKIDSFGNKINSFSKKGNALNEFLQKSRSQYGLNSDIKYKTFDTKDKENIIASKYKGKWYTIGQEVEDPEIIIKEEEKEVLKPEGSYYMKAYSDGKDLNIVWVRDTPNGPVVEKKGLLLEDKENNRQRFKDNLKNYGLSEADIEKAFTQNGLKFNPKGAQTSETGKSVRKESILKKEKPMNEEQKALFLKQFKSALKGM